MDILTVFHKEINKASEVDETWFKEVVIAKKSLRGILEEFKKKEALLKQPKLFKAHSEIIFPEEQYRGSDQSRAR